MKLIKILTVIFVVTAVSLPVAAEKVTIENLPPVVIKTYPVSGSADVSSTLGMIKVTFSKKMLTKKMWSWVMITKDSFPEMNGEPYFERDGKTCVLPVKLKPGKTYAIWINSQKFNYFRDLTGNTAVPYLLVFKTK